MIYQLIFLERKDYAQAKSQLHLLQEYSKEYDDFLDIEEVIEISDEEAKLIMLINAEYDEGDPEDLEEISLFDIACGEDFAIIGTSQWE